MRRCSASAARHAGGRSLETLARERVFAPLGMQDSSLEWQPRFEANHAQGREWDGEPVPKKRMQAAAASWSLLTTARGLRLAHRALPLTVGADHPSVRWLRIGTALQD